MIESTKLRIFVVDDNARVADLVSIVLRNVGFQVFTFYDAHSAMRQALESQPDVVVTDYSMPHMDGLELATWLQDYWPECKIVILTGDAVSVAEKATGATNFTLLHKPAHPDALIAVVRQR